VLANDYADTYANKHLYSRDLSETIMVTNRFQQGQQKCPTVLNQKLTAWQKWWTT